MIEKSECRGICCICPSYMDRCNPCLSRAGESTKNFFLDLLQPEPSAEQKAAIDRMASLGIHRKFGTGKHIWSPRGGKLVQNQPQ